MNSKARRAAPVTLVAAAVCSVVCLLVPRPAWADPTPPGSRTATVAPGTGVPDAGAPPVSSATGPAATALPTDVGPLAAQITTERNAVELLGEQVTEMDDDVAQARQQAQHTYDEWRTALDAMTRAKQDAVDAAARAYQDADSLGPLDGLADEFSGLGALAPGFGNAAPATPPDPAALAALAAQAGQHERDTYAAYHSAQVTADALANQQATLRSGRDQRDAALRDLITRNQAAAAAADATQQASSAALAGSFAAGSNVKGAVANPKAIAALTFALSQRGKPYVWGAEGPNSYDCSGLVWASYRTVGVTLPRVARDQQHALTPVPANELLPGDLIFFNPTSRTDWTSVSHVGIYAGNGEMVEAPTYGQVVKKAPVWWSAYFSAARVFPAVAGRPTPHPTSPSPIPAPTPSTAPSSAPPSTTPSQSTTPSSTPSAPPSSGPPSATPKPSSSSQAPATSPSATPSRTPSPSVTPSK